jgi:hypothetical protein
MRYLCEVCKKEAFHNEKLDIHFCKKHGFRVVPDLKMIDRDN